MANIHVGFDERLRSITRHHDGLRAGVRYKIGSDGLILAVPRRHVPRFPLKSLFLLIAVGFAFKVFLYLSLGGVTYDANVQELRQGSALERAGAWVLQADEATRWTAHQFSALNLGGGSKISR